MYRDYGLLEEDYDLLVAKRGPVCPNCLDPNPKWSLDHCHETGVVRGFTCQNCNTGIGYLKDDVMVCARNIVHLANGSTDKLDEALEYLRYARFTLAGRDNVMVLGMTSVGLPRRRVTNIAG